MYGTIVKETTSVKLEGQNQYIWASGFFLAVLIFHQSCHS